MGQINERPVIVKINEGEITNSVTALNRKYINVDLFNGTKETFNTYKLLWNQQTNKFNIGVFQPREYYFDLNSCRENGVYYLNGAKAEQMLDVDYELIVGTHIKEEIPTDELLSNQHIINCDGVEYNANLDFIYVQMTTGVTDNFGNKKNRKTSQNTLGTASQIKELCDKNDVKLGFSHYLTGSDQDPEAAGINQAKKFLKAIVGSETEIKDKTALEGGMIPMVIFMDNITQVGYYGSAPYGVIKSEEII